MVVGYLGTGKTSIAQAVEFVLTGDCGYYRKRTDDRNELIHDLFPEGAALTVTMETDRGRFTRMKSAMGQTWSFDDQAMQNVDAMDRAVSGALNVTKDMLSAILNVGRFFDMEPATQKEMIISLIGADVTPEKVVELFNVDGDASEAFKLLTGPINSLAAIQNAYQYSFERRTVVKRELKDLKPPGAPEGEAPPVDKIRALLETLRKELETKVAARARLDVSSGTEKTRERLKRERERLLAMERPGLAELLKERLQAEIDATSHYAELYTAVEQKVISARAQILSRDENVKLLSKFNGRCVAGDHVCPAPAKDMEAALEAQQRVRTKLKTDVSALEAELADLGRKRDDKTGFNEAYAAVNKQEEAIRLYEHSRQQLTAVTNELDGLPDAFVTDTRAIDGEIQVLRDRILNGEKRLADSVSWVERARQVTAVAEKRARLEKEVSQLEQLVEFFGPKGVKVKLIDERIGGFVTQINQNLAPLGFELAIQVEPWRILWGRRPISRISRSERFRMAIPFQIALAKLTGLNFIIVDDAELLTPEARSQVMRMIVGAGLDQAVVIMTFMSEEQFLDNRKGMSPILEPFVVKKVDGVSTVEKV